MVGEHNPTNGGALQTGTRFRKHGLGLNKDVSLNPPQPPEALSHRRVLPQTALESWTDMLKTGFRPRQAPAR